MATALLHAVHSRPRLRSKRKSSKRERATHPVSTRSKRSAGQQRTMWPCRASRTNAYKKPNCAAGCCASQHSLTSEQPGAAATASWPPVAIDDGLSHRSTCRDIVGSRSTRQRASDCCARAAAASDQFFAYFVPLTFLHYGQLRARFAAVRDRPTWVGMSLPRSDDNGQLVPFFPSRVSHFSAQGLLLHVRPRPPLSPLR